MNTLEGIETAFINKVESEEILSEKVKFVEGEMEKKNNDVEVNMD